MNDKFQISNDKTISNFKDQICHLNFEVDLTFVIRILKLRILWIY